jgi:DNA-binding CsgD family transcriptional regulator
MRFGLIFFLTISYFKITVRQVEFYRQAIFKKLLCKNIGEAIAKGLRYGEISMI